MLVMPRNGCSTTSAACSSEIQLQVVNRVWTNTIKVRRLIRSQGAGLRHESFRVHGHNAVIYQYRVRRSDVAIALAVDDYLIATDRHLGIAARSKRVSC